MCRRWLKSFFYALAFLGLVIPAQASALPNEFYKLFGEGVRYYDPVEGCPSGTTSDTNSPTSETGTILPGAEYIGHFTGPMITPTAIVLHWTAGEYDTPQDLIDTLESRVDEDYPDGRAVQLTIDKTGKVYQLSEALETQPIQTFNDRSWNEVTIGIEIESGSFGEDLSAYENDLLNNAAQYASVLNVVKQLMGIYGIENVADKTAKTGLFGHYDIQSTNSDPGTNYMAKVREDIGDEAPPPVDTKATSTNSSCACSETGFGGSNNVEIAFNFFVSKGLTEEQSAGIVGNLMRESGPDLDYTYDNFDTGVGIAQWIQGRADNLVAFAEATGRDYLTLEVQLEFIWFELTGEPPTEGPIAGAEAAAYDALIATTTVAEAATEFEDKYERSQDTVENGGTQERIDFAEEVYDTYAGGSTGAASCALGSGELGVFPLITSKADIQKGSTAGGGVYLTWCFEATTNCHHDYNAADIHVAPSTKVVASVSGEVVSATEAVGGVGSRVTIKSSDGKYINYYAHMAYQSLTVDDGDTVSVGQELGEVGVATQAVGTAPHLHIDFLPGDEYDSRPSCSGAGCAAYPFIDMQGLLKNLYDTVVPES